MKSKRNSQGTAHTDGATTDLIAASCGRELTCHLQNQPSQKPFSFAKEKYVRPTSLLEALDAASDTQRLVFWQAIEHLARGLSRHQRTNISLNRSRLLLTNGVLQGAVLITPDAIPRVEFLLVDASLNRTEIGALLLTAALEPLRASGVQQVTARVSEDDTELIALFQDLGFTV